MQSLNKSKRKIDGFLFLYCGYGTPDYELTLPDNDFIKVSELQAEFETEEKEFDVLDGLPKIFIYDCIIEKDPDEKSTASSNITLYPC